MSASTAASTGPLPPLSAVLAEQQQLQQQQQHQHQLQLHPRICVTASSLAASPNVPPQPQLQQQPQPHATDPNALNNRAIMEGRVSVVMDLLVRTLRLAESSCALTKTVDGVEPASSASVSLLRVQPPSTITNAVSLSVLIGSPANSASAVPSLFSSTSSEESSASAPVRSHDPACPTSENAHNHRQSPVLSLPSEDSRSNLGSRVVEPSSTQFSSQAQSLMSAISSLAKEHYQLQQRHQTAAMQYKTLSSAPKGSAVFRDRQRLTQLMRQVKQLLLDVSVKKSHIDANIEKLKASDSSSACADFIRNIQDSMAKNQLPSNTPFVSMNLGDSVMDGSSSRTASSSNFPLPGSIGYIPHMKPGFSALSSMSEGVFSNRPFQTSPSKLRVSPQPMSCVSPSQLQQPPAASGQSLLTPPEPLGENTKDQSPLGVDAEMLLVLRRLSILVASAFAAPVDPFGTHFLLHALILIRRYLFPPAGSTSPSSEFPSSILDATDSTREPLDAVTLYLAALMLVESHLRDGQTSTRVWRRWLQHACASHRDATGLYERVSERVIAARRRVVVAVGYSVGVGVGEYDAFLKVFRGVLAGRNGRAFERSVAANAATTAATARLAGPPRVARAATYSAAVTSGADVRREFAVMPNVTNNVIPQTTSPVAEADIPGSSGGSTSGASAISSGLLAPPPRMPPRPQPFPQMTQTSTNVKRPPRLPPFSAVQNIPVAGDGALDKFGRIGGAANVPGLRPLQPRAMPPAPNAPRRAATAISLPPLRQHFDAGMPPPPQPPAFASLAGTKRVLREDPHEDALPDASADFDATRLAAPTDLLHARKRMFAGVGGVFGK
ncbi:hypothetical protein HDU84_001643 [Entophlyctis sp. JEL0112]|nr:hypothetical protein HDU84_001643 [Entophlyctis sp. JEL0112]